MKTLLRTLSLVTMFTLLPAWPAGAQVKQVRNADTLKEKAQQLEAIKVDEKPTAMQLIHKRALFSVYKQLLSALQEDLALLEQMKGAVDPTDAETQREIARQMRAVQADQVQAGAKVQLLKSELQSLVGGGTPVVAAAAGNDAEVVNAAYLHTESPAASDTARLGAAEMKPEHASPAAESAKRAMPVMLAPADCASTYTDAPPLLVGEVEKVAGGIFSDPGTTPAAKAKRLERMYPALVFYTVAHAIEAISNQDADQNTTRLSQLKAYKYLGEIARTDKQTGASARAAGTTSAIEKPGFARLLGLATEKGAITQDVSSTSVTLSTSPYVLYTLNGEGDTEANYQRAGYLNRVGLFASFNLSNKDNPLANVSRSKLTEWSVRYRFAGDRSTRTQAFENWWGQNIQPFLDERATALVNPVSFILNNEELSSLSNSTESSLESDIEALLGKDEYKSAGEEKQKLLLKGLILCHLRKDLFDPIKNKTVQVSPEVRTQFFDMFIPRFVQAQSALEIARKKLDEKLDDLAKSPLGTFAYTNHRQATGSDYSELKLMYEQDKTAFRLLKIVGNAGLTFYNSPDATLNQQRLRDFNAALSFEGKASFSFFGRASDPSKITYAFTGTYERMRENTNMPNRKADIGAFQFRLEVPMFPGISLPIAVTYANATEQQKKEHTRANFGLSFDVDKLFAFSRLMPK